MPNRISQTHVHRRLNRSRMPRKGLSQRKMHSNNTSGVTGVYFYKRNQNWKARISVDGVEIYLGTFSCFIEAVKARKDAEKKYWDS